MSESLQLRRYWAALGQFIHEFAGVELHLKILLMTIVGARKGMAQAVWSGTRADAALSIIKRVYEADGMKPTDTFQRAADQFGLVNSVRNRVAHYAAQEGENGLFVSDFIKALPGKHTEMPVSDKLLIALSADCRTIRYAIVCEIFRFDSDLASDPPAWQKLGNAPWQYIPPKLPQPNHSQPRKGQKPKAPPKP